MTIKMLYSFADKLGVIGLGLVMVGSFLIFFALFLRLAPEMWK